MKQTPLVGVGIIIQKGGSILLGKRIAGHGRGLWQSAGGHIEFGEHPQTTALREIKEEVGIQVRHMRFITITSDVFTRENKRYFTLFFVCDYKSGTPRVLEPHKCSEWRWFPKNRLPKNLFLPYNLVLNLA